MDEIHWRYIFNFNSSNEQQYNLYFDAKTMRLLDKSFDGINSEPMPWTELKFNQCQHCPLSTNDFKHCPPAAALGKVAKKFADVKSYTETKVAVVSSDRTYLKSTSTQEALHSIFGLIMATSDCPYLNFLRPMARFHLPFSNSTETLVRSLSFFLMKQLFNTPENQDTKFDLKNLIDSYQKVQTLNYHLVERIRSLGKGDADMNAIVILDNFASLMSIQISENFAELRPLFD